MGIWSVHSSGVAQKTIRTMNSAWTNSNRLMQMYVRRLCLVRRQLIHVLPLHIALALLISAHGGVLFFLDMHMTAVAIFGVGHRVRLAQSRHGEGLVRSGGLRALCRGMAR